MSVSVSELRSIPLFQGITDEHMTQLLGAFEQQSLQKGEVLFEAGSDPTHFYVLIKGEIALREEGEPGYHLHPPAPIGELGALTGIRRYTTAIATEACELLRVTKADLMNFFEDYGDVAFPFYHNLLEVVGDKIRRDRRRMEEMRANIIRTQKAMKRLRDLVLESEDSELSAEIYDTLDGLISNNRRAKYVVEPPAALPCYVRMDDGTQIPVRQLSAVWLSIPDLPGRPTSLSASWSGVLLALDREIPLSGTITRIEEGLVTIELDLLIDDFAVLLEDYITRSQMLDVVV